MRDIQNVLTAIILIIGMTMSSAVSASGTAMRANENRTLVVAFYEQFFNRHDVSAADQYIGDVYIQHNPNVPNGRQAFVEGFSRLFTKFPQRRSQIIRVVAEGDLVVLHVHLTTSPEDRGTAVVDIFRLENGRIVEHWDVQQQIPLQTANANTMF